MKKYIKNFIFILSEITIITLFFTFLNYLNILSSNIYSYLELASIFIILYLNAKKLTRSTNKFSFLEGIKIGLFFILIFLLYNIIFKNVFSIRTFIYYLLIIFTPLLGSIRKSIKDWKFSLFVFHIY